MNSDIFDKRWKLNWQEWKYDIFKVNFLITKKSYCDIGNVNIPKRTNQDCSEMKINSDENFIFIKKNGQTEKLYASILLYAWH